MVLALPLLEPQVLEMIRRRALQKKHSVVVSSKALIQAAFDAMRDPRYLVPLYVLGYGYHSCLSMRCKAAQFVLS
jgi:hypothetical protein